MFKRANKITALLVAAASVMSVVPAMASDKLGTKDGTIEKAVAFSDGKYAYQGYRTDSDSEGIYYNDGSKDKLLEDIEDADLTGAYSDKYAQADDNNDQYLVDLTNGSVSDDNTPDDDRDNATTKIKSKLKKADRYKDFTATAATDNLALTKVRGQKFGDVWYEYSVTPAANAKGLDNTVNGKLYGFTNGSGQYVDACDVANIYAYSTKKGKVVKIDEFSNSTSLNDFDEDSNLLATLVEAPEVLAQDKDNLYVKVVVDIADGEAGAKVAGTTTSASATITGAVVTRHEYVQKISKAQGDQKDDAYVPKEVTSYELLSDDDKLDNGDSKKARTAVDAANDFSIVNGVLYAIDAESDNVAVTSINLKKEKVKYLKGFTQQNLDADKVDVYLAEKDDDDNVDVDNGTDSYDIDVDGNVWLVADGKIEEFKNNEFTKVYSVDSSLDSISAYDENNIVTWVHDDDIYTTVAEGKAETAADATPAAPATVGWSQAADGTWTFFDATGTKVVNNWVNYQGAWYFLKADGVMATGWQQVGGTWYYLNASGAMATGWVNDGGSWYYLQSSGAMATGWVNDNGTWYYLNASGAMLANTTVDGYVLGASGAWIQ